MTLLSHRVTGTVMRNTDLLQGPSASPVQVFPTSHRFPPGHANGVQTKWRPGVASPPALNCVGPKQDKQPRMIQSRGEATASPQPTLSPSPGPSSGDPPPQSPYFPCHFPGCPRYFISKIGRGVHMKSAHPDWTDEVNRVATVKTRWSLEELSLLARREAELSMKGVKNINQALMGFLPGRTLYALKGARKREDYRALVEEHIGRIKQESERLVTVTEDIAEEVEDGDRALLEYFRDLEPLGCGGFRAETLDDICSQVGREDRGCILERLTAYLADIFPPPRNARPARRCRMAAPEEPLSRRRLRRVNYGKAQKLWRKDPKRCLAVIKDGPVGNHAISKDVMVPYWEALMTGARDCCPPDAERENIISSLWSPVNPDEVRIALPERKTAPGPDGLSARILRKTPLEVLQRIYNLIMWCRRLPLHLRDARTVLIPKIRLPTAPSDFRPITVASTLVRGFHKVLALRMCRLISLDERQRAFRTTDGCADNVFVLDLLLRHAHTRHKPLYVASVDVAKAFDTVSHRAILQTLELRGCPAAMIDYVGAVYSDALTTIVADGWHSHAIHPLHGVRQGDPMSPHIFNMVLDRLLRSFPQDIGADIDGVRVGSAAFADDLILAASTTTGLQRLLDRTEDFLASCGMSVNVGKSFTISIGTVPHQKKTTVDKGNFVLGGQKLVAMKRTDSWMYLGIPFTPDGRLRSDPSISLTADLDKISRAPLKPQQRLFALRVYLLPGLFYAASLGSVGIGKLNRCDMVVRRAVRKWLDLPADTPKAYFHSTVVTGGLGITSLRWSIPRIRLNRLNGLSLSSIATSGQPGDYLRSEIHRARMQLMDHGEAVDTPEKEARRWAKALHESVDGGALKESKRVPGQHRWVAEGSRFLSGRDFVNTCKLRINALPTKSRTSRGRRRDRHCRAGCVMPETLNHVLQHCHRTHDVRIRRHDAVVAYLARGLEQSGFQVSREPKLQTDEGMRKPDLVVSKDGKSMVLDAQVVGEQVILDLAHKRKVQYYAGNASFRRAVASSNGTDEVGFYSATLSWRGLWSAKSARELVSAGLMKKRDIKVISSRVLVGGLAAWSTFNRRTTVRFNRAGIG